MDSCKLSLKSGLFAIWCVVAAVAGAVSVVDHATGGLSVSGAVSYSGYASSEWDADGFPVLDKGKGSVSVTLSKSRANGTTPVKLQYSVPGLGKGSESFDWNSSNLNASFARNGHSFYFCLEYYQWNTGSIGDGIFVEIDGVPFMAKQKGTGGGSSGVVAVPAEWQKARTLGGVYGGGCGFACRGTVQVKCGKANRQGVAKVSMSITPFNGRKTSFKATSVDVSGGGEVHVVWAAEGYEINLSGDEFFGAPSSGPGVSACSDKSVMSARIGGEHHYGYCIMFPDFLPGEDPRMGYVVYPNAPECVEVAGTKILTAPAAGMRFEKCPPNASCGDGTWYVDTSRGRTNVSGLKFSYNAKTGVVKGSFTVYTFLPGKKYKFTISGAMIDGSIRGVAFNKSLGLQFDI